MDYRELHYRWEWQLRSSPQDLWPFLADTNRFNRDTGVPAVEVSAGDRPRFRAYPLCFAVSIENRGLSPPDGGRLPNSRRRLRLHLLGMAVAWEEQPFEWIRPYRFGVIRRYTQGPVAQLRVQVELAPQSGGGTHLIYEVWAQPRNALGLMAIPAQIGLLSRRSFDAAIRRYDTLAASGKTAPYPPSPASFAPGGRARLAVQCDKLRAQGAAPAIVQRLAEMLEQADDLSLGRIRSHALADYWGVPRRDVLQACLWATRTGLLDLQWDLICPHCRGAKETSTSLRGIRAQVYCDSCNIDFTVSFEQTVELTFRPNPAIRVVEAREYCVGGPQVTPHIVAQQLIAPGEERRLPLSLETGRYRLRALELPGGQFIEVAADGQSSARLRASENGWPKAELKLAPTPALLLENATAAEQLFILERMAWSDRSATAAEVTALQIFRDLFSNEALRPGQQISVGRLTVLFTDLRGSTRLYREIGDAPAFGRVMSHFDVLREVIADEDGALVKTIGDAVMAVFRRPAAALRAIAKAQRALASPSEGVRPLLLKAGMHAGPCIAVTQNDRLDYFGRTVNLAARLEGLSAGDDIILSAATHADPEVAEMLADPRNNLFANRFDVMLKGFDDESFELWRVTTMGRNHG